MDVEGSNSEGDNLLTICDRRQGNAIDRWRGSWDKFVEACHLISFFEDGGVISHQGRPFFYITFIKRGSVSNEPRRSKGTLLSVHSLSYSYASECVSIQDSRLCSAGIKDECKCLGS